MQLTLFGGVGHKGPSKHFELYLKGGRKLLMIFKLVSDVTRSSRLGISLAWVWEDTLQMEASVIIIPR